MKLREHRLFEKEEKSLEYIKQDQKGRESLKKKGRPEAKGKGKLHEQEIITRGINNTDNTQLCSRSHIFSYLINIY